MVDFQIYLLHWIDIWKDQNKRNGVLGWPIKISNQYEMVWMLVWLAAFMGFSSSYLYYFSDFYCKALLSRKPFIVLSRALDPYNRFLNFALLILPTNRAKHLNVYDETLQPLFTEKPNLEWAKYFMTNIVHLYLFYLPIKSRSPAEALEERSAPEEPGEEGQDGSIALSPTRVKQK